MPASVDFFNDEQSGKSIDERVTEFENAAQKVGLKYPVLCKL